MVFYHTMFKNIIVVPIFEKTRNRTFHQFSHLVSCDLSAASVGGGISSLSRLIFDFFPSSVHKSPVKRGQEQVGK